jgi:undecaprenyl-diphosphatase
MVEFLKNLDTTLFRIINIGNHNLVMDTVFPVITNFGYFKIPVIILALLILVKGSSHHRKSIIVVAAVVLLADFLSSQIMKSLFQRVRPCQVVLNTHLLVNCSSSFSFPSSHATNIFAFASTSSYFYPRWKYFFLATALLISYSRVYVGVHYPFDCVFGAILGIFVSFFFIKFLFPLIEQFQKETVKSNSKVNYEF